MRKLHVSAQLYHLKMALMESTLVSLSPPSQEPHLIDTLLDHGQGAPSAPSSNSTSTVHPPPPPPAPPHWSSPPSSRSTQSIKDTITLESRKKALSMVLPSPEEEIRQTIERLATWRHDSSGDSSVRWLACNKQVTHLAQDGPTCGLVAMCMAAKLLQKSEKDPEDVLSSAKEKGYTLQGEMFSASNTLKFAEEEFSLGGRLLNGGLNTHITDVIVHLARGLPILVPYDRDSNNEPTCRKGHSAHWAVLTGFAMTLHPEADTSLPCQQDDDDDGDGKSGLVICPPPWSEQALSSVPSLIQLATRLYLFARQGKSRLLGAWLYGCLATSNENLVEYDPMLEGEYVYHPDGLAAGLAGKLILLE